MQFENAQNFQGIRCFSPILFGTNLAASAMMVAALSWVLARKQLYYLVGVFARGFPANFAGFLLQGDNRGDEAATRRDRK
jgi:hypothetical protein